MPVRRRTKPATGRSSNTPMMADRRPPQSNTSSSPIAEQRWTVALRVPSGAMVNVVVPSRPRARTAADEAFAESVERNRERRTATQNGLAFRTEDATVPPLEAPPPNDSPTFVAGDVNVAGLAGLLGRGGRRRLGRDRLVGRAHGERHGPRRAGVGVRGLVGERVDAAPVRVRRVREPAAHDLPVEIACAPESSAGVDGTRNFVDSVREAPRQLGRRSQASPCSPGSV